MDQDLNLTPQNSESARGKHSKTLQDIDTSNDFLNRTPIVQEIKAKNDI
jgi:hypothetical protein